MQPPYPTQQPVSLEGLTSEPASTSPTTTNPPDHHHQPATPRDRPSKSATVRSVLQRLHLANEAALIATTLSHPTLLAAWAEFRDDFLWDPSSPTGLSAHVFLKTVGPLVVAELAYVTTPYLPADASPPDKGRYVENDHYVRFILQVLPALRQPGRALHSRCATDAGLRQCVDDVGLLVHLLRGQYRPGGAGTDVRQSAVRGRSGGDGGGDGGRAGAGGEGAGRGGGGRFASAGPDLAISAPPPPPPSVVAATAAAGQRPAGFGSAFSFTPLVRDPLPPPPLRKEQEQQVQKKDRHQHQHQQGAQQQDEKKEQQQQQQQNASHRPPPTPGSSAAPPPAVMGASTHRIKRSRSASQEPSLHDIPAVKTRKTDVAGVEGEREENQGEREVKEARDVGLDGAERVLILEDEGEGKVGEEVGRGRLAPRQLILLEQVRLALRGYESAGVEVERTERRRADGADSGVEEAPGKLRKRMDTWRERCDETLRELRDVGVQDLDAAWKRLEEIKREHPR